MVPIQRFSLQEQRDGVDDVGNKRKKSCGRKRKATVLDSLEEMKKLPNKHKKSQTRLSTIATGVSKSTIFRRYQSAGLKKTRVHMLPHLTNLQRITRVQFALSQLHEPFDNSLDRHFKSQFDTVHLDEKLFYISGTSSEKKISPKLKSHPL